jgi:hypothetical protein
MTSEPRLAAVPSEVPLMQGGGHGATPCLTYQGEGRSPVKLPKIKTLNHQIDVIEASSTATEARLANIETLLEQIAGQIEKKTG